MARDRKTNLVCLLTKEWAEFEGIVGFVHSDFDPNITQVWSRGAIVLKIDNVREGDRGRKVYVLDFNSFTLDEEAGGFFLGVVKYAQRSESGTNRACVGFSCLGEEPLSISDLRLDGRADIRM